MEGLEELRKLFKESMEKAEMEMDKLVKDCPYETRLAVTEWVFKHICKHAKEGGSFRYLIYERLGFDMDAYTPLFYAGGLDISNYFTIPNHNMTKKVTL